MNDSTLRAHLEQRYGVEKLAKMDVDEFADAVRSTISAARSTSDFAEAKRSGIRHVAALEFPHLSPAQLEDIVTARCLP